MRNKKGFGLSTVAKFCFYLAVVLVLYFTISNFFTVSKKIAYNLYNTELSKYEFNSDVLYHPALPVEHRYFFEQEFKQVIKAASVNSASSCLGFFKADLKTNAMLNQYSIVFKQSGEDVEVLMNDARDVLAATDQSSFLSKKKLCLLNKENDAPVEVSEIKIIFGSENGKSKYKIGNAASQDFYYEPYQITKVESIMGFDRLAPDKTLFYNYFFKFLRVEDKDYFCLLAMKQDEKGDVIYNKGYFDKAFIDGGETTPPYANFCTAKKEESVCQYSFCSKYNGDKPGCEKLSLDCNGKCYHSDTLSQTDCYNCPGTCEGLNTQNGDCLDASKYCKPTLNCKTVEVPGKNVRECVNA